MTRHYTDITFTDGVKAFQEREGVRENAAKVEHWAMDDQRLGQHQVLLGVHQGNPQGHLQVAALDRDLALDGAVGYEDAGAGEADAMCRRRLRP